MTEGRPRLASLVVALVLAGAVVGCVDIPEELGAGFPRDELNTPPVLAAVGTRLVHEGDTLLVLLDARDADGDRLAFAATPLPPGAHFDPEVGVLEWTPALGAAQQSPYRVTFAVTDGREVSTTTGTIVVDPPVLAIREVSPSRIPESGGVRVTVQGLGFAMPAEVFVGGVPGTDVAIDDDSTLKFTSPPLPGRFGPQLLGLSFPNNRDALIPGALFVYREASRLGGGLVAIPSPRGALDWTAADLDGDHADELIVVGETGVTRMVFGALAAHTMQVDEELIYGGPAAELLVGAFDGDEHDDLAVLTPAGRVLVMHGGVGMQAVEIHGQPPATAVALLDLEGDGDDDIVALTDDGNAVLYAALAGHTFSPPIRSLSIGAAVGGPATELRGGDFDGDGEPDLLVSGPEGFGVARGLGTGAFLPTRLVERSRGYRQPMPFGSGAEGIPQLLALGDEDLAFFVWRAGLQGWALGRTLSIDGPDGERRLADLDDDGLPELLTSMADSVPVSPGVHVHPLSSAGLWRPAFWWMTGPVAGAPATGDFDGDGLPQGVLQAADGSGFAVFTIPNPAGSGPPLGLSSGGGIALQVRDFTFDAVEDVMVIGATHFDLPALLLFEGEVGQGRPFSELPTAHPSRADIRGAALVDLTGDLWFDVLLAEEGASLTCYQSRGSGVYAPPIASEIGAVPLQLLGLERGALPARAAVRTEQGDVLLLDFDVRCNHAATERVAEGADLIDAADLDGDGRAELLVVVNGEAVYQYAMPSSGPVVLRARLEAAGMSLSDLAAGDVTGDETPDLAFAGDGGVGYLAGPLQGQRLADEAVLVDGEPASGVAVADLNGDGPAELVAAGGGAPPRVLRLRDGGVQRDLLPDWHREAIAPVLADLDGDADPDLVTLDPEFGPVIWWNEPGVGVAAAPGGADDPRR